MIIIDKATQISGSSGTSGSVQHTISSQDAVLVVLFGSNSGQTISVCQYNGVSLTKLAGGTNTSQIWWLKNPPVGTFTFNYTSNSNADAVLLTILGVDKSVTPVGNSNTGSSTTASVTINIPAANSMVIDVVSEGTSIGAVTPPQQVIAVNNNVTYGVSYIIGTGLQQFSWTVGNNTWSEAVIALEPAKAASIWNPNIQLRTPNDISRNKGLDTKSLAQAYSFGNFPSTFFQNSFLHTIGRMLNPPSTPIPSKTNETEISTSQFIIDKVFQGQTAASALSTVNLNLQVNIPSKDAVLVLTGGSVIATGAPWASVQYNGTPLVRLVQAAVAGADAEIWWLPNPPVGTGTLSIASGTGGEIYANAMVILGVDKTNLNIITSSATDAATASTISTLLDPDVPNALVIDTLSTFDNFVNPVPDQSQTQVFNATALAASENLISTYKIASLQGANMNYNLGISVNAALVAVAFRPAKSASIWNPNIYFRTLDDVVTANGLDSEFNPAFGSYGYKASTFYQNSFLHTIGRTLYISNVVESGSLRDNLIGYWPMNEGTGTTIYDYSQNKNHGIITNPDNNTVLWDSRNNNALRFNGRTSGTGLQTVRAPNIENYKNLIAMSFQAWIYQTDTITTLARIIDYVNGGATNQGFFVALNSNTSVTWNIRPNGISRTLTTQLLPLYQWIHIVGVWNGQNMKLYLNGVNTGTSAAGGILGDANHELLIGNTGSGRVFPGSISKVGFWNRALREDEITRLYNNGQGLNYPFLPNGNQFSFGPQGYNYYANNTRRAWQSSFLQTIGRINQGVPLPPSVAPAGPWRSMMGMGY